MLPSNEDVVAVLLTAAPALHNGFEPDKVLDAAFLLNVSVTRSELLRMYRAWHQKDEEEEAGDVAGSGNNLTGD